MRTRKFESLRNPKIQTLKVCKFQNLQGLTACKSEQIELIHPSVKV